MFYKKRISRIIPFGWVQSAEHPDRLESVDLEILALDRALEYYKDGYYSLRALAVWLTTNTGRYVGHSGLKKLLERHYEQRADYIDAGQGSSPGTQQQAEGRDQVRREQGSEDQLRSFTKITPLFGPRPPGSAVPRGSLRSAPGTCPPDAKGTTAVQEAGP